MYTPARKIPANLEDAASAFVGVMLVDDDRKIVPAKTDTNVSCMYLTPYSKCSPRWKKVQKARDPAPNAPSAAVDAIVSLPSARSTTVRRRTKKIWNTNHNVDWSGLQH